VIGVIGGSGFYSLLADAEERTVETPYGAPSDLLTVGTLAGRDVAFLPRHGADHRYPPHLVPYRANLWALRSLGVRQVVSLSAVGSLTAALPTGTLVVPDQIADRTSGRPQTYFDGATGVGHASLADPYCPRGRVAALSASSDVHDGGTLVVINGPRFSTRAESLEYQSHGWTIIGMTAMPEAALARELALCYTTLALVTDLDAASRRARASRTPRCSRRSPRTCRDCGSCWSGRWSSCPSRRTAARARIPPPCRRPSCCPER
jgi:Purine nucleoside phosphorylase